MKEFNINKTDLEQIERLLKINTNIDKIYTQLCSLEIEGKTNAEEYKKHLEYLSIFIEGEDKLYEEINLNLEKALSWSNFLTSIKNINSITIRENIMRQNYDDRIISRILSTLLSKITKDYNTLISLSEKELINITTLLGINITKYENKDKIAQCIITKNHTEKDIYYTFLSFLQEQIEDPKQKFFKERLITAKYNMIYVNKDIESSLLLNNFNIEINTYVSSEEIIETLIDKNLYYKAKDLIGATIINTEFYELLEISDMDYSDIAKASTSILRGCMMKSAFLFMSDEIISNINYEFHEYTEDKEYQNIHPNNNISNTLITNHFKNIKNSKSKVRKISLK